MATDKKKTKATETFEGALEALEQTVAELESGDLGLDEALARFEHGIELARTCRKKLDQAERKIEMLVKRADSVERVPLPLKDDTGEIEDDADIQGELL